jgi:hypothetical protein
MADEAEKRRARLAAELRENLRRRKAQQRGRKQAVDTGREAPVEPKAGEPDPGDGEPPVSAG